jgi:hypothetical protein
MVIGTSFGELFIAAKIIQYRPWRDMNQEFLLVVNKFKLLSVFAAEKIASV